MIKHLSTFSLLVFLSLNSISQEDSWQKFISVLEQENLKVKQVKIAMKKLETANAFSYEEFSDCDESYESGIYPKYKVRGYSFCRRIDSLGYAWYFLKFISFKNKIIHLRLYNPEDTTSSFLIITNNYQNLLDYHSNKMKITPDISHKYFNPFYRVVVSFGCYYGGIHFPEMKEMNSLVESLNKNEIIKWCYSLSPEIRCHGAFGLIWLFEKGDVLSIKEKELIRKIYNEETQITTCSGCTGFDYYSIHDYMKYEVGKETIKLLNLN